MADPKLDLSGLRPKVLIFPIDILLAEKTTGGLPEFNALWTLQGKANALAATRKRLAGYGGELIEIDADTFDADLQADVRNLIVLHSVVGSAIVRHKYVPEHLLPTKADRFDWALGPAGRAIARRTGARYGLFFHIEDSYAGPGRVAAMIAAGVLFGYYLEGGQQAGHASLVDLQDGRIVWFNRIVRDTGDLRTPEGAVESIEALLSGFPDRKPGP